MIERLADRFWRWRHQRVSRAQRLWERAAVSRGYFPSHADLGGAIAVDLSGEVWRSEAMVEWDRPERVSEPGIRFAALGVAIRRHPALAHLVPARGPSDPVCPSCHGVGYLADLPASFRYRIICQCGGLGWLPEALARAWADAWAEHDSPSSDPPAG